MKKYHSKKYLIEQLKNKDYIKIAEENKVDTSTIQRWMRKNKLTSSYDYWTSKEIRLLKENYSINRNVYKLFSNKTKSSINHKASRLGLRRIVQSDSCEINQDFFKNWNNQMAYIFGWFCSDGFVSYKKNHCGIHLNSKDKEMLEKIKKTMNSKHNIQEYENSVNLRIYNKILCSDLINLGCYPRKSTKLKFPSVPDKYLMHFIRGYFDGDGSIHFNKPNTIKVSFIASKSFIKTLQVKLNKILGLKIGPIQKHYKIWICIYYGDDARKLCKWMYKNSKNLYLQRKKDRFDKHMRIRNGRI